MGLGFVIPDHSLSFLRSNKITDDQLLYEYRKRRKLCPAEIVKNNFVRP